MWRSAAAAALLALGSPGVEGGGQSNFAPNRSPFLGSTQGNYQQARGGRLSLKRVRGGSTVPGARSAAAADDKARVRRKLTFEEAALAPSAPLPPTYAPTHAAGEEDEDVGDPAASDDEASEGSEAGYVENRGAGAFGRLLGEGVAAAEGPGVAELYSVAVPAAQVTARDAPTAAIVPALPLTPIAKKIRRRFGLTKNMHRLTKYGSFFLLVVQNSALTCTMRWSRAHSTGPLYFTSTAVVMSELAKILVSGLLLLHDCGWSPEGFKEVVSLELLKPDECLKLFWPAVLYTVQNNLQYVAAANLQPAVFQVMYQVKMLTTAALSVTMLGKRLKPAQWGGVGLLTAGLVLVQLSQSVGLAGGGGGGAGNAAVGFAAVLASCTLAGFAGCYLERVLQGCSTSLWVRNLQLSGWGALLGALSVAAKDGPGVRDRGFFHGYTRVVWAVVGIQAAGGLLISLVVRYGDALLKGFATGLAIIITTAVSARYFDFAVTPLYLAGASTTFLAVLLYSGLLPAAWRALAEKRRAAQAGGGGGARGAAAAAPPSDSSPGNSTSGAGEGGGASGDESAGSRRAPDLTLPGFPWSKSLLGGASSSVSMASMPLVLLASKKATLAKKAPWAAAAAASPWTAHHPPLLRHPRALLPGPRPPGSWPQQPT